MFFIELDGRWCGALHFLVSKMSLHLFSRQVDPEVTAEVVLLERAYDDALALVRTRKVIIPCVLPLIRCEVSI